jgi:diacylglycerol kinase (ATP)
VTVLIIANPAAGRGKAIDVSQRAATLLRQSGLDVDVCIPTSGLGTREAASDAVSRGVDAVIVCGGDGTTHDALQALVGSRTALGVLPAGSGDDVAGGLGLETGSLESACSSIAHELSHHLERPVDVGEARDGDGGIGYFASVLCTGFDARVNARANTMRRWWGRRYTLAMLRELASFKAMNYTITADDECISTDAMIVSVGNGPRYGGGMLICPSADIHDCLLDITILKKVSRARLLWSFRLVFTGAHVTLPFVTTVRATQISLTSPGATAYADGERLGPLPVTIRTLPGALKVVGGAQDLRLTP